MKEDFKLEDIPKHNIYQVPEHYFERLPMRVMERTAGAKNSEPTWQRSLWLLLRPAIAPLVLLLVFAGVYFVSIQQLAQNEPYAVGPLAKNEILNYLNAQDDLEISDFSELNSISKQELTVDFVNISATAAEEELEYYHLRHIED